MVAMKISKRISWSFVLILLIFFLLSSIAFGLIARRTYYAEARVDLKKEATYLRENDMLLARILAGEKRRINRDPAELSLLLDSNLILVSDKNRIVYSENEVEARQLLLDVRNGNKPDDMIFVKQKIERPEFKGTMYVYYRIEELNQAMKISRRAGLFGFLFALPFTLLLAGLLQRRISRPVRDLKERMVVYSTKKGMTKPVEEAEDEIEVLSHAFDALRETIEENEHNREVLFSNISHELKTPLMTIRGYAEGIQEGVILPEHGLKTIIEETGRLNEFALKVLALSKLSTQPITLEKVNLAELLKGTQQRYAPVAAQDGLSIQYGRLLDEWVEMDEERFRQAIGNLLSNAMRYAKTKIELGVQVEEKRVGIYVEDDGQGVPDSQLQSIFTRFEKGDQGQTGLGLAIVQRIMEQHEGEAVAENRESGFRVILWFPKRKL
jgi:signal transduction histidine kinase